MVQLKELVRYCDELLQAEKFRDYAPNGLQVEGRADVGRIVTGVTASQALIDAAVAARADALVVHHGFFWKGESPVVSGVKRRRLRALLENEISLIAYHLPLDGHAVLGNNAQLAQVLGLSVAGRFGRGGDELAMFGQLPRPMTAAELSAHIHSSIGREPLHIGSGAELITRVGWCSGAAQGYIEAASEMGVQAFISGEVSEQTTHFACESGVHYFAAGHHATERYGVQALGRSLAERFGVDHEYIDVSNPV